MREGILYEFADREGFISGHHSNENIAELIDFLGGKFKVTKAITDDVFILDNEGNEIQHWSFKGVINLSSTMIYRNEFKYFQPVVDSEIPLKQPNVTYVYDEKKVEEGLKQILEENDHELFDDLFYMSAPDAAKVLSEKLKPFLLN